MAARMRMGRSALEPADGPLLVSVGVFDGLHRGHVWLLEHLVGEARLRSARAGLITFDAHPDAVLHGSAPPLLMDPAERLERVAEIGVEVVVVEHFDDELRRTPYDVFVAGIRARCGLAGFVMTPDAAFGHERAGTPAALAELGRRDAFDVVLVAPFTLQGHEVRSSEIRAAIAAGDLATAERLLGRPYSVVGDIDVDGRMTFAMPVALPPAGRYPVTAAPFGEAAAAASCPAELEIRDGTVRLVGAVAAGSTRLSFAPPDLPNRSNPDE